jgi:type II secretory pathway component PulM
MAQFNLNDYETVEERIRRFYKDNPDGRIITENQTTLQDRQVSTWVVYAAVYLTNDRETLARATGLAYEIDGVGMANKTSALENAETSAIGRALANAGYSGNKRASREEMAKVARDKKPSATSKDWLAMASELGNDLDGLRLLYSEAKTGGADTATLDKIKAIANGLSGTEDSAPVNP